MEPHQEDMVSHQGWIRSSVSRLDRRSRGTSRRRTPFVQLGRSLGAEPLEARLLLSGQAVQLIKDVNNARDLPQDLTPAGSNLFYTVEDSTRTGVDLMVTNAGGTQILLDTAPITYEGSYSPIKDSYSAPLGITAVGSSIFFTETITYTTNEPDPGDTSQYSQFWTSDGTAAGTFPINIGPDPSPTILGVVGSTLIFDPNQEAGGSLDAISPGSSTPTAIAYQVESGVVFCWVLGSTMYFSEDGDLWSTDGTAQHTKELVDPASSQPIPAPRDIFEYQGQVYYIAGDPGATATIGILDAGGETPVVTGLPNSISSTPVVAGSLFYFATDDDFYPDNLGEGTSLWASNGTQDGTTIVKDFTPNERLVSLCRRRELSILHGGPRRRTGGALDVRRYQSRYVDGDGPGLARGVLLRLRVPERIVV